MPDAIAGLIIVVVGFIAYRLGCYRRKNKPITTNDMDGPLCSMCLMDKKVENLQGTIKWKDTVISNQADTIRELRNTIHGLCSTNGKLGKELQGAAFLNSGFRAR